MKQGRDDKEKKCIEQAFGDSVRRRDADWYVEGKNGRRKKEW